MSNDKTGNGGNGVTLAQATQGGTMCPIDEKTRPQDCRTFNERLLALESGVKVVRGEIRMTNKLLGWMIDQLKVIAAAQGRKVKDPRTPRAKK